MKKKDETLKKFSINLLGKKIILPRSWVFRQFLGWGLIIGGILGFLPILGFWMLPLGLLVLSRDSYFIRRIRRKMEVLFLRRWNNARFYRKKLINSK